LDIPCYFIETENKNAFVCRNNIVDTLIYDNKLYLTLLLYHVDKFGVFCYITILVVAFSIAVVLTLLHCQ